MVVPSLSAFGIDHIYVVGTAGYLKLESRIKGLYTFAILEPLYLPVEKVDEFVYFIPSKKSVKFNVFLRRLIDPF